jgi:hypothetical protein
MAKRIIVLGVQVGTPFTTVGAVFWYPVTVPSSAKTQTSGSIWTGAVAAENAAIQAGTVIEEQNTFQFPTGLASATMEAWLLQYWTQRNVQINGTGPNLFNGVFNDSLTGWSA